MRLFPTPHPPELQKSVSCGCFDLNDGIKVDLHKHLSQLKVLHLELQQLSLDVLRTAAYDVAGRGRFLVQ